MAMETILVMEDDEGLNRGICFSLEKEGYRVFAADGLLQGKRLLRLHPVDLVLLDIALPDGDGYAFCKELREYSDLPIIMLTARDLEADEMLGFEAGADDYITKPFDMRELLARLRSLLRRLQVKAGSQVQTEIQLDGLMLNLQQRKAVAGEKLLDLTPKEFDLLALLAANPERVYTRDQLLDLIWGMEYMGGTRTVDIHVQRVRKKLGPDYSDILQTIHGVGYKASI